MHETTAQTLAELDTFIVIGIVAICKNEAEETGENHGEMTCPRCNTGTLRWVRASNGHMHVQCDRRIVDGVPDSYCVNAME